MRARPAVSLLLASLLPWMTACYSYLPVAEPTVLQRGDRVRVQLAEPADQRLRQITANDVVRVDGEVAGVDDTTLVLSAWWLESSSGLEHAGEGWTVRLERDNIASLEERRASGLRTGLVVAASVAGALALGAIFISLGGGDENGDGNGPPPQE